MGHTHVLLVHTLPDCISEAVVPMQDTGHAGTQTRPLLTAPPGGGEGVVPGSHQKSFPLRYK